MSGYGNTPVDALGIPIAAVYVPGVGLVALQGGISTSTDGSGNLSTPANFNLSQISDLPVTMGGSDGVAPANVLEVVHGRFNGATIDQDRGNLDGITVLNVTASTGTQTSPLQVNYNGRGCIVVLKTTNIGSGSITLEIDGMEPVTSTTWQILVGTAVTTNTTVIYRVYPGLTAVANATAGDILPRSWQVKVTANNANPADYGVYAVVLV